MPKPIRMFILSLNPIGAGNHLLFYSMTRLSKFILTFDKPTPAIQDVLSPLASKIVGLLVSFKPDLEFRTLSSADKLRNQAALSLTPQMSGIKAPEPDEKVR